MIVNDPTSWGAAEVLICGISLVAFGVGIFIAALKATTRRR